MGLLNFNLVTAMESISMGVKSRAVGDKTTYAVRTHWDLGHMSACGKHGLPKETLFEVGSEVTCKVCMRYAKHKKAATQDVTQ